MTIVQFREKGAIVSLIALLFVAAEISGVYASQPPRVAGCQVFACDSIWNRKVDDLPVHANSGLYIETIGSTDTLHPDFGEGPVGGSAHRYSLC
jgi:hypothetical protein